MKKYSRCKRLFFSSIFLLFLASCGKSETETKNEAGNTIEFENIKGDTIRVNGIGYANVNWYHKIQDICTISKTDSNLKEEHDVNVSFGMGKYYYDLIQEAKNRVKIYDKNQQLKLSLYRISFSNIEDYLVAKDIAKYPYYNNYFNNNPTKYNDNLEWAVYPYISGTKYEDYYSRVEIYSEVNTLEYFFSESFLYENKSYVDKVKKEDLKPFVTRDSKLEYGILQYAFSLEPVDENDEIIKFASTSTRPISNHYAYPTNDGICFDMIEIGDYVIQVDSTAYYEQNYMPAFRMITGSKNTCIPYVIEDDKVQFYSYKEVK